MKTIDVLIIGGGPAGCAAAITAAKRGRAVLVVDRSDFSQPRVGETLPPAVNPILDKLGLLDVVSQDGHLRSPGMASAWGSSTVHLSDQLFDPDGEGWHLDRNRFDRRLVDCATAAGASVRLKTQVRCCRQSRTDWEAELVGSSGTERVRARALVDAAGRTAWPGRPFTRFSVDRLVAMVRSFQLPQATLRDRRTWTESVRDGWWYVSAVPLHGLIAAYFTDSDLLHIRGFPLQSRWEELLTETVGTAERLRDAQPSGSLRIVSASTGTALSVAGDNWIAAGDATVTIDPLSSHGILYALQSGWEAANTLLAADRELAIEEYRTRLKDQCRADMETRRRYYRMERRWPGSPFWRRRSE